MRRRQAKKFVKDAQGNAGFSAKEKASDKFVRLFSREIRRADYKDEVLGVRTNGLAVRRRVLGEIRELLDASEKA